VGSEEALKELSDFRSKLLPDHDEDILHSVVFQVFNLVAQKGFAADWHHTRRSVLSKGPHPGKLKVK
jgi:hypothetical protein